MAAVTGLAVGTVVTDWLKACGIDPRGVKRMEITIDVNDLVEILLHRHMQRDEVGEFQELLGELSRDHVLVAEKYRLENAEEAVKEA